jgi:TonB-linked SusC/RagA family outer membrane protein
MLVRFERRLVLSTAVAALAVLTAAAPLSAQQAVISGRITSDQGNPLGGASVGVANSDIGAIANESGNYTITIAPSAVRGQQIVLTARFIGYKPMSRTVTVTAGTQEVNFQLARDPLRLEEMIVTGVGEATPLRKTTFTVSRVDAEQLQEVPGASALVALQGKVSAVRLVPTSAQPGGEVAIRLRGATSISGRQDPLYIVDGVITQFGLADVAPEDVERVEVIKGAAASSLYGSNAANGVVQVFTKRGNSLPDGALRVSSRIEVGTNNLPKKMEFSKSHAWRVDAQGNYVVSATGARQIEADQIADNPFKTYLNHWDEVVVGGAYATQYISVGQRRGPTNFNASVQNTRNEGVIYGLGGYTRQNYRLNLDQRLRSNVDASWSAFFGKSNNGRTEEGQGGPFFGLMFLQPDVDITAPNADGSPFNAVVPLSGDVANDFNPLYELHNRKINQDRDRFSGSSRLRWRLNNWLSAEGSFGYDQEAEGFSDVTPFGFLTSSGTKTDGRLVKAADNNSQYNGGVTVSSIRTFMGGDVTNTTKLGATFEQQKNSRLSTTANILKVSQVPEFAAAEQSSLSSASFVETIRTRNFMAITTFDIKDRYLLDGLVRQDASSLFGPENREAVYYRLSGAWRVTEDFTLPWIDELKLKTSYGTAGLRPEFSNQYEILQVTAGGFTKNILGNTQLKPAQSAELEMGANLEFGGSRYTLEYTYAKKNTTDQILLVDLPSVVGFKQQWQNTGALEANTHEMAFGARLYESGNTSFTLNIVGDKTKQVITEWNLPNRLYSFQQMPAAFFLCPNSNLGAIHGNKWIRNIEELYDDPAKAAASGPGQLWHRDNVMINEDGYVVRKDAYGTLNERAIKYTFCKRRDASNNCVETSQVTQIGDANPDFNMSVGGNLRMDRFVVNALLDMSQGGDLYNGTRQWAFQATRDRVQDQSGKPANATTCGPVQANPTAGSCPRKPLAYYAVGFYNGLDPSDYFVEDGSYMKLKELSVHYTFLGSQLERIGLGRVPSMKLGLVGRNLLTFTDYSGLDPEVSGLFGDPFQVKMDWFQYPQFRTFSAVVEITF